MLLEVVVEAYQVVHGIDEVSWWSVDDLKNLHPDELTDQA